MWHGNTFSLGLSFSLLLLKILTQKHILGVQVEFNAYSCMKVKVIGAKIYLSVLFGL